MNIGPKQNLGKIELIVSDKETLEIMSMEDLDALLGEADDLIKNFEDDGGEKEVEELKDIKKILNKLIKIRKQNTKKFLFIGRETNFSKERINIFEKNIKEDINNIEGEELFLYLEYIKENFSENFGNEIHKRLGIAVLIELPQKLNDIRQGIFERRQNFMSNQFNNTMNFLEPSYQRINTYSPSTSNNRYNNDFFSDDYMFKNISELQEEIKRLLNPFSKIIDKIKDVNGGIEGVYRFFYENPEDIKLIDDKDFLDELIKYHENKGEKIKYENLNNDFLNNKDYLLHKDIEVGNKFHHVMSKDFLNSFENEEEFFKTIYELIEKEDYQEKDIKVIIDLLVQLEVNKGSLRKLIMEKNIYFISKKVSIYTFGKQKLEPEEQNFFNKLIKEFDKNEDNFKKICEKYNVMKWDWESDGLSTKGKYIYNYESAIDDFLSSASSEEKDIFGNYLFFNSMESTSSEKKHVKKLIEVLIIKGFSTESFDLILNQREDYMKAFIDNKGIKIIGQIKMDFLNNEDLLDYILNNEVDKNLTIEEKIKCLGEVNFNNPNRVLQIIEYLNKESNGDEEKLQSHIRLFSIHSKNMIFNIFKTIREGNGSSIEEKYQDLYIKIKKFISDNQDYFILFDNYIDLKASVLKNKSIAFEENESDLTDNIGLLESLHKSIIDSGLNKEIQKKINDILSEAIDDKGKLTTESLMIIYGLIISESKLEDLETTNKMFSVIADGLQNYQKELFIVASKKIKLEKVLNKKYIVKEKGEKADLIFDSETFFNDFINSLKRKKWENTQEIDEEYNKFINENFLDLTDEEKGILLEIFKVNIEKNMANNPDIIRKHIESGSEESMRDYFMGKGIDLYTSVNYGILTQQQNTPQQISIQPTESISNFYFPDIPEYNPISGTYSLENKTLSFSQDEISQINKNKENLNRILNFYKILDSLGLNSIWGNRKEIFKGLSAVKHEFKPYDDNYLQEHEVKMFLDAILISTGTAPNGVINSDSLNLEQYIVEYKKFENTNISGSIKKDADSLDRSKMEAKFMNEFFPQGSFRFDLEKFIKAYNSKGESLERKS